MQNKETLSSLYADLIVIMIEDSHLTMQKKKGKKSGRQYNEERANAMQINFFLPDLHVFCQNYTF